MYWVVHNVFILLRVYRGRWHSGYKNMQRKLTVNGKEDLTVHAHGIKG